ncbi:DNA-directed DNA polymerase [Tanacetum coccineum]
MNVGNALKEPYYTQFGEPFQGGGYRATAPEYYQRNNTNPLFQERRQSMEDTLSKFMSESAKRHEENSNLIKKIRVSTDAAIRNQGASIKTLEIQIGQMSKLIQTRYAVLDQTNTPLTVELADRTVKYPKGIAKNVLVGIGKFTFLIDFIILDIPEDVKVSLILGRPFLSTARDKIDVYKRKITLRVGKEKIIFKSVKPAVLEDIDAYRDNEMGDIIFGEPFLREIRINTKRFKGIITLYNGFRGVPGGGLCCFARKEVIGFVSKVLNSNPNDTEESMCAGTDTFISQIVTENRSEKCSGNVGIIIRVSRNTDLRADEDIVGKKGDIYNCVEKGMHTGSMLEAEAFLADVECTAPYDQPLAITTTNMFEVSHEDAYDSDVDERPHAAATFMANLSLISGTNGATPEEHLDSDVESDIDDNTIPYHQYQLDSEVQDVPTEVSSVPPGEISMITILDDLRTQLDGHLKVNQEQWTG